MRGAKRFGASESAPDTNDAAFRNKRVMAGSTFDAHRAEPSQPQSNALPPLDTRRAESSRQHVRALNTQFASWVQTQLKNHPDELWEDGVRDYLAHASNILEKFSDVVNWLKANAMKAESTSESLSTDKRLVPEFKGTENKLLQEKTGLAPPSTSTGLTTSWSSSVFSSSQSSGGISSNNSNIGVSSSTPSFGLFSNTQGSGGVSSNNSNLGVSSSTLSFGLLSNAQGSGGVSSNNNSYAGVSSGTQSFGLFSNTQSSGGVSSTNPNSGVFSSTQSSGLFSGTQASGLFSNAQSSGLFSNSQSSGFLSNSQSTGLFSNSQSAGLFSNGQSTGLFSKGQSIGVFSTFTANSQTPVLDGNQSSAATNNNTSDDADDENELQQPSSPSVKKSEEKGIIVVHEVKCKLYVKSSDPADKDAWKDKGTGQLSIKCKEGVSKGTKESTPTIVVRNDVGKVMLNALLYPGIKTNSQKNSIVAIFHTAGDDAGNSDKVVARTFLIRTKTEEDRNKLATAIQEYAPSS